MSIQPRGINLHPQLTAFLDAVSASFTANDLIKITLAKPGTNAGDLKSIDIRPVLIKRDMKLSFTHHYKTRDIVKNYSLAEARVLLTQFLTGVFLNARGHSVAADIGLTRQGETFILATAKPTMQRNDPSHNRTKNHLVVADGKHYLQALGLTDGNGEVLKTAQDKFRQINKYIEIIDGLIKDFPPRKLRITDMGAGKGYLTFAIYDHLAVTLKRECEIIGVEMRADLVALCNDIAKASNFSGLTFVQGTIAGYDCAGADIVIALHACDTATDDAIAKAVKAEAQIIVVAPCCHKQIRREMKATAAQATHTQAIGTQAPASQNNLEFLLRYGTYRERLSEMITDSLRAQLMELSGYECNLFEFISDAHTPKNIMIVAKRLRNPRTEAANASIAADIAKAKRMFGIGTHQLEQLLGN
jgi:Methyltransferase domain